MAWTAHKKTTYQPPNGDIYYVSYYGISDGSELTDYVLVGLSALTYDGSNAPTKCNIIDFSMHFGESVTAGASAWLEFDSTADTFIAGVGSGAEIKMPQWGSVAENGIGPFAGAGGATGDICLTTLNTDSTDSISIFLHVRLIK